jgi:hypothetical protein
MVDSELDEGADSHFGKTKGAGYRMPGSFWEILHSEYEYERTR